MIEHWHEKGIQIQRMSDPESSCHCGSMLDEMLAHLSSKLRGDQEIADRSHTRSFGAWFE